MNILKRIILASSLSEAIWVLLQEGDNRQQKRIIATYRISSPQEESRDE